MRWDELWQEWRGLALSFHVSPCCPGAASRVLASLVLRSKVVIGRGLVQQAVGGSQSPLPVVTHAVL